MENLKEFNAEDFLDGVEFMGGFSVENVVYNLAKYDVDDNNDDSDSDVGNYKNEFDGCDINEERTTLENDHVINNLNCNINCSQMKPSTVTNEKDTNNLSHTKDNVSKQTAIGNEEELTEESLKSCLFRKYKSQYSDVLNVQIVEKLENDLDLYERISIVFLVYEDSQLECALQRLIVASKDESKTHNLLSSWCQFEPTLWREKLLQALVVVKNFYVLLKLGYKKNNAKSLFHKKNYIPSIRKKIYYFCESLSIEDSKCLIEKVNNDLKIKNIYNDNNNIIDCNPKFLEFSFLFWLSRKYIRFYSKDVYLKNLIDCLDNSERFCNMKKELQIIHDKFSRCKSKVDTKSKPSIENDLQNSRSSIELQSSKNYVPETEDNMSSVMSVSTMTSASSFSDNWSQDFCEQEISNYYKIIDPTNIGLCIIVNQKNFQNREKNPSLSRFLSKKALDDRDGTDADKDKIKNTFAALGYIVCAHDDLPHDKLLKWITDTVKKYFKRHIHSSILLFILTHGFKGHVYACNSICVPIELIKKTLWDCEQLIGKPKGIIIQACQGDTLHEAIVSDGPAIPDIVVPDGPVQTNLRGQCDLFLGLATVAGHVAFRDRKSGTWFIQILCQCIDEFAYTIDFAKIFTRVNEKISKMRTQYGSQMYGQVSECRSSLCSDWFLVPPRNVTR